MTLVLGIRMRVEKVPFFISEEVGLRLSRCHLPTVVILTYCCCVMRAWVISVRLLRDVDSNLGG